MIKYFYHKVSCTTYNITQTKKEIKLNRKMIANKSGYFLGLYFIITSRRFNDKPFKITFTTNKHSGNRVSLPCIIDRKTNTLHLLDNGLWIDYTDKDKIYKVLSPLLSYLTHGKRKRVPLTDCKLTEVELYKKIYRVPNYQEKIYKILCDYLLLSDDITEIFKPMYTWDKKLVYCTTDNINCYNSTRKRKNRNYKYHHTQKFETKIKKISDYGVETVKDLELLNENEIRKIYFKISYTRTRVVSSLYTTSSITII